VHYSEIAARIANAKLLGKAGAKRLRHATNIRDLYLSAAAGIENKLTDGGLA